MVRRIYCGSMFLLVWGLGLSTANGNDNFSADRFMEIVNAVMDNHIDPPAKQEMILAGAKALYPLHDRRAHGISRQVSSLSTDDQFAAYIATLRAQFVSSGSEAETSHTFISGMLSSVPGGAMLLPPEEARVQAQLAANRYVGIGIALSQHEGLPLIMKSMAGGSGFRAGVKDEDLILEIDGQSTKGKSLGTVVQELRGEEGTEVTLLLQQSGQKPRKITVVRSVTFIPTIEGTKEVKPGQWEYTSEATPDIAILRFLRVGPSTAHELKTIEAHLRDRGLRGVVLDLRRAGGTLHDTVTLADQLLDAGVMGSLKNASGVTKHEMQPGSLWKDIPLVAVVDASTGAGPVYLAAALQDSGRAKIVGEIPRANSYVKSRIELSDGSSLELATGTLQRANGVTLMSNSRQPVPPIAIARSDSIDRSKLSYLLPDSNTSQAISNVEAYERWLTRASEYFAPSERPTVEDVENASSES